MKDNIRKILKEYVDMRDFTYFALSKDDRTEIKKLGRQTFENLKEREEKFKKLNNHISTFGITLTTPTKRYCEENIDDITFALDNISTLNFYQKKELESQRELLRKQLNSIEQFERGETSEITKYIQYFHELPNNDNEEKKWSIVNLFDDNIIFWIEMIKLKTQKYPELIQSENFTQLIKNYFALDNNTEAMKDLVEAMARRENYREQIFARTWDGGREVENKFVDSLPSSFNKKVFSGEKNIVDNKAGIDLAVECNSTWIPIQVKSSKKDAEFYIPKGGYSVYPSDDNSFKLVSKDKDGNFIYKNLEDICTPVNMGIRV